MSAQSGKYFALLENLGAHVRNATGMTTTVMQPECLRERER